VRFPWKYPPFRRTARASALESSILREPGGQFLVQKNANVLKDCIAMPLSVPAGNVSSSTVTSLRFAKKNSEDSRSCSRLGIDAGEVVIAQVEDGDLGRVVRSE